MVVVVAGQGDGGGDGGAVEMALRWRGRKWCVVMRDVQAAHAAKNTKRTGHKQRP